MFVRKELLKVKLGQGQRSYWLGIECKHGSKFLVAMHYEVVVVVVPLDNKDY